jgi:hypothetical protein
VRLCFSHAAANRFRSLLSLPSLLPPKPPSVCLLLPVPGFAAVALMLLPLSLIDAG